MEITDDRLSPPLSIMRLDSLNHSPTLRDAVAHFNRRRRANVAVAWSLALLMCRARTQLARPLCTLPRTLSPPLKLERAECSPSSKPFTRAALSARFVYTKVIQ